MIEDQEGLPTEQGEGQEPVTPLANPDVLRELMDAGIVVMERVSPRTGDILVLKTQAGVPNAVMAELQTSLAAFDIEVMLIQIGPDDSVQAVTPPEDGVLVITASWPEADFEQQARFLRREVQKQGRRVVTLISAPAHRYQLAESASDDPGLLKELVGELRIEVADLRLQLEKVEDRVASTFIKALGELAIRQDLAEAGQVFAQMCYETFQRTRSFPPYDALLTENARLRKQLAELQEAVVGMGVGDA